MEVSTPFFEYKNLETDFNIVLLHLPHLFILDTRITT